MAQITYSQQYSDAIQAIKHAILQSRYTAAKLVNREMLALYYGIGEYISFNSRINTWGTGALEFISQQLQQELPGLRGFSVTNLKKMRTFFENWNKVFSNRPSATDEKTAAFTPDNMTIIIRPLTTDEFSKTDLNSFLSIGFTHHYELLLKTSNLEERLFYIRRCASEFWSVDKLKYYLLEKLYSKQITTNNFSQTITNVDYRKRAIQAFKDEYMLDFINIEDIDEIDERVIENQIIQNIKKFIMALGSDFSFIGNQYRLIVDEQEYFIDLLFFNRRLQALIAIELKRGEFKPEYIGKLNFYLSALDEYVRLPHENSSIGIILCKSQRTKTVEFAFRDTSKPMGVATYKLAHELPKDYEGVLPKADDLKKLMEEENNNCDFF